MSAGSRAWTLNYARRPPAGLTWVDAGLILAVVIVFLYLAGSFAEQQAIWLDETTQLSGLALPFGEQLAWLAGRSDVVLGVPPDRMPPLSYWMGSLWAAVFGLSERSMRWMGIVTVCAAAPALYLAGRITGGRVGALFVMGLVLLSGNVVSTAGDIRAYPLFFSFSAWAAYFYVRLVFNDNGARQTIDLVLLCLFLLLATYTHFFGLLAAGCIMAALLTDRILTGCRTAPIIVASTAFGLLTMGILPFVLSAVNISGGTEDSVSFAQLLRDVARLVFRLFVHPSQLIVTSALVAYLCALTVLVAIGLLRLRAAHAPGQCWQQPNSNCAAGSDGRMSLKSAILALPLGLALIVLVCARFAINSFEVFAPHYNIWLVPLVGIVLALAFREDTANGYLRNAAVAAGGVAIACSLVGVASLKRHAQLYSHGPGEWVAAHIEAPEATLIIHGDLGPSGHLYFPIYFLTGGVVEQWYHDKDDGQFRRIGPYGREPVIDPEKRQGDFETVMEVHTVSMDSMGLAAIARGESPCAFEADRILPRAAELLRESTYCAFFATRMTVYSQ